jgi:4-amino-4-deoxy-L-arabinose transferase-like glycosyltransferase
LDNSSDEIQIAQKRSNHPTLLVWGFGVVLLGLPVGLVMYERWFSNPGMRDVLAMFWCRNDLYCPAFLPSYFALIIPLVIEWIVLFLVSSPLLGGVFAGWAASGAPAAQPTELRRRLMFWLFITAATLLGISMLLAVSEQRLPAVEVLLALCLVLLAFHLREADAPLQLKPLGSRILRLAQLGLGHAALLYFLHSLTINRAGLLPSGLLLVAVFILLIRWVKPAPIYWVTCAAMVLMGYRLWGWEYAVIGDEYSFYSYALQRLGDEGLWGCFAYLFKGAAVYGSHPFLSTLIQMFSLSVFGLDHFGWRISNIYLTGVSVYFFFIFFRAFLSARIALWAAILLAFSHYLFNFSKIGYNNLQALFAFGLMMAAAARSVRAPNAFNYALTGAAIGLCFYVYPAALYGIPAAGLLLVMCNPPRNKTDLQHCLALLLALGILLMPLLFQPEYWQSKLAGTFLNENSYASQRPLLGQFSKNIVYAFFTYLYAVDQSHFVVASHIDPISALLLPPGLCYLLLTARRERFGAFLLISYAALLFLAGATHDRFAPSTTRMFMLLPWYAALTAIGLGWLLAQINPVHQSQRVRNGALLFILTSILAANLYMAYGLYRRVSAGNPSLEVLFIRLAQRDEQLFPARFKTLLFLTESNWDIEGLQTLAQAYRIPPGRLSLARYVVESGKIPAQARQLAARSDTLVIIQPWMNEEFKAGLNQQLLSLEKQPCPIQDTPASHARFTLYLPAEFARLCPPDGHWLRSD